jgi:LEA14-like dessication related protein
MFLVSRLQTKAPAQLVLAITLLAGSIGGIQGCASLQPDYDEPVVTVTSFRAVPAEGAALNFEIGLRVVSPNSEALELQGIAYTISLEGHKLITGVGKDLPVLEGYSEETFTLQASASMFQTIQLVSDLMREPKESLQYDLETKLDVGTFYPAIRVRKSGEISLQPTQ